MLKIPHNAKPQTVGGNVARQKIQLTGDTLLTKIFPTGQVNGFAITGTLKKSTSGWNKKGNGNNSSGIAGLPGGLRFDSGAFGFLGTSGYWSSSSEGGTDDTWIHFLGYNYGAVGRVKDSKSRGFSVRCLRD